jgi:hypothetical protein
MFKKLGERLFGSVDVSKKPVSLREEEISDYERALAVCLAAL